MNTIPEINHHSVRKRRRNLAPFLESWFLLTLSSGLLLFAVQLPVSSGFLIQRPSIAAQRSECVPVKNLPLTSTKPSFPSSSTSALNVWWMGGTESTEAVDTSADSCELVPVRIERPTPGSRKIFGEIHAPLPLMDVWAILTDYDRLALHVPNLKESRITGRSNVGSPGDGQYRCRLYQVGAQKIIGFDFSASVTMDMQERIISDTERCIVFKCVDSFFFQEFDGEWKVAERSTDDGSVETKLSYFVNVRPKGPVPVAALEWRIREDVPTNLRAVKIAAISEGHRRAIALKSRLSTDGILIPAGQSSGGASGSQGFKLNAPNGLVQNMRAKVQWFKDETMATYLSEK